MYYMADPKLREQLFYKLSYIIHKSPDINKRYRPGYTSWYVLLCKEHQL